MRTLAMALFLLTGLTLSAQGTIDREVGEFHEITLIQKACNKILLIRVQFGETGTWAIYILGDVQHGLWQR